MTRGKNYWALTALILTGALFGPTMHPALGLEEERVVRKKVIKVCDGDDCGDQTAVFIDENGERTELSGDDHVWVEKLGHGLGHGGAIHLRHGEGPHGGFLGVQMTELTPELRTHFGVPDDAGVLVAKVVADSPAERAGIRVGDILTAVGGEMVARASQLAHEIRRHEEGDTVNLELWRDGQVETISATLDKLAGETMHRRHRMRMGGGGAHAIVERCDDAGDCESFDVSGLSDLDCGESGRCEVNVQCDDGSCECTVNGAATDCETIPGFEAPSE